MSQEKDAPSEVVEGEVVLTEDETEVDVTDTVEDAHPIPQTTANHPPISTATTKPESFIDQIKQVISDGSRQRLIVETRMGNQLIDVSLALGLAISGMLALLTPFLAVILVILSLVTKTTFNIMPAK